MIDSVPLIQNANDAQQINASIIAMKKASRELDEKIVKLNSLNSELDKKIALLDSGLNKEIEDRKEAINSLDVPSVGGSGKYISAISEADGKISATASDITSSVSSGNSQPVTSGGVAEAIAPLQPINSVTSGSLQPVTSGAVYAKLLGFISKDKLPYTTLTSGQNINNLKTEGVYQAEYDAIGNSLIGRPNEYIYSSFLFVMIPKNNAVVQIIISCGTGNIYVRQANTLQADWKDWHKLSYTTIAPTT